MADNGIHISKLLCYCIHYINNSYVNNIKKIIANFHSLQDIYIAKKLLWELGREFLDAFIERKSSEKMI